jgi:hypothetical protein
MDLISDSKLSNHGSLLSFFQFLFRNSTVGFKKIKDTFRACSPIVIESNNSGLALKSMAKAPALVCTHPPELRSYFAISVVTTIAFYQDLV